jgi:hypothetical protein
MSAVEKLAQTPLLNRLFRTQCTAIQPVLDLMRHYGMCDARTLYFNRKMGGRTRCTLVFAKRFQGEHSGLIERLGSDLNRVLNSIRIAERNGACFPGAHGRQNSIFVFCSPLRSRVIFTWDQAINLTSAIDSSKARLSFC